MKFKSGLCIAFVDQTYLEILASTNNFKNMYVPQNHKYVYFADFIHKCRCMAMCVR